MTYEERRIDKLSRLLKGRCKADGEPKPGYAQNVASIRAEIEQLTERLTIKAEQAKIIAERAAEKESPNG